MAIVPSPAYAEVYEFLLSSPTPEQEAELDEFERVNHFVSMLKIYARQQMKQG